jgi:hypothetical protein
MENNEMKKGTTEFDSKLKIFFHYQNHPQMLPFVGKYWGKYKKLLVIGESHYLSPCFDITIIENWYNSNINDLDNINSGRARSWTNTSELIDDTDYKPKGHTSWKNIKTAIHSTGFDPPEDIFCYIAYMNFFQRPAQKTGESINVTKEDCNIANEALAFIINIIIPDYIFFVSSKAWQYYNKKSFDEGLTGHSAHSSCPWWNRKSSKYTKYDPEIVVTGKESFMDFIIHNKIFS